MFTLFLPYSFLHSQVRSLSFDPTSRYLACGGGFDHGERSVAHVFRVVATGSVASVPLHHLIVLALLFSFLARDDGGGGKCWCGT
jgi:hypothetical protein